MRKRTRGRGGEIVARVVRQSRVLGLSERRGRHHVRDGVVERDRVVVAQTPLLHGDACAFHFDEIAATSREIHVVGRGQFGQVGIVVDVDEAVAE